MKQFLFMGRQGMVISAYSSAFLLEEQKEKTPFISQVWMHSLRLSKKKKNNSLMPDRTCACVSFTCVASEYGVLDVLSTLVEPNMDDDDEEEEEEETIIMAAAAAAAAAASGINSDIAKKFFPLYIFFVVFDCVLSVFLSSLPPCFSSDISTFLPSFCVCTTSTTTSSSSLFSAP